jgi:energy-coupling factor transporter ATP-binding protein EcfA2
MRIKKLEIIGFKSFLEKAAIHFPKGISAIVVPNGCGKSNITDAIRWVMGEQSTKQLRGKSMDDVIVDGLDQPLSGLKKAQERSRYQGDGHRNEPDHDGNTDTVNHAAEDVPAQAVGTEIVRGAGTVEAVQRSRGNGIVGCQAGSDDGKGLKAAQREFYEKEGAAPENGQHHQHGHSDGFIELMTFSSIGCNFSR